MDQHQVRTVSKQLIIKGPGGKLCLMGMGGDSWAHTAGSKIDTHPAGI